MAQTTSPVPAPVHPSKIGPLALYALMAQNVFSSKSGSDFFSGLLPFYEPFIQDNDGKIFDKTIFSRYSDEILRLPITDDIVELLATRMQGYGWLVPIKSNDTARVLTCTFDGSLLSELPAADVDKELSSLRAKLWAFLKKQRVATGIFSDQSIDDDILHFLAGQLTSRRDWSDLTLIDQNRNAKEYWIAKFCSHASLHDPNAFSTLQAVGGVALLAEALLEARTPTLPVPTKKPLTVFLDGPLLMQHMGLSGASGKSNIDYVLQKLTAAGASVCCFRHACEEIRDVLFAMLNTDLRSRHGLTWEAVKRKELTEGYVRDVLNRVEYYVKAHTKVKVLPQRLTQLTSSRKYCDDDIVEQLAEKMTAQAEAGRARDAESLAIVMRRRAGKETSNVFDSEFLFLTGNAVIVGRSNDVLRYNELLGKDRTLIGPAIHHRALSGLLFANSGIEEKKEISRREILSACARVLIVRPKILSGLNAELSRLGDPKRASQVEAMLTQPRATEILMDKTVGAGRTISRDDVEEVIQEMRQSTAEDVKMEYDSREQKLVEEHQSEITRIDADLKRTNEELVSVKATAQRLEQMALAQEVSNREVAQRLCMSELKRTKILENRLLRLVAAASIPLFALPVLFPDGVLGKMSGILIALTGVVGWWWLIFNRKILAIERYFEKLAIRRISTKLEQVGLMKHYSHFIVSYPNQSVSIANPPSGQSQ